MRIAYGVFGYGRGHATRTASILPDLRQRHEVQVFAGGDAYDQLSPEYPVVRVPTLGYGYDKQGRLTTLLTFKKNLWHILEMTFGGPEYQQVRDALADFRPDVVISDAEPFIHRAARHLKIPRIGFDHFGVMVYCRPRIPLRDRIKSRRDVLVYRFLMGRPERIIVSSFYDAKPRWDRVRVIGPLLRDEVLNAHPTRGDYLLAYFNKGEHLFIPRVEQALRESDMPVRVYGTPRRGTEGNLTFKSPSNMPFVEDMAGCRAIVSTAGNQLVGEAVQLGKPMLVMPEASVEQRLNASSLAERGFGMQTTFDEFDAGVLRTFLANEAVYVDNIRRSVRNGREEAVATIEQFIHELVGPAPTAQVPQPIA